MTVNNIDTHPILITPNRIMGTRIIIYLFTVSMVQLVRQGEGALEQARAVARTLKRSRRLTCGTDPTRDGRWE